jgi:hypothetical protein
VNINKTCKKKIENNFKELNFYKKIILYFNLDGCTDEFRAHPVHSSTKLKAGGTGALEMTYFLKKPLPKTNVGTVGYIKV